MKSLRIALSLGFKRGWGTYWRAYFLGQQLVLRGHQVTLYCISAASKVRPIYDQLKGIKIVEGPNLFNFLPILHHGNSPLDIAFRIKELSQNAYDVVHGFEYSAVVSIPAWVHRKGKNFVYVSDWCDWVNHGIATTRSGKIPGSQALVANLEDLARNFADGVTVISSNLWEHVTTLGHSPDNILYLPAGTRTDEIRPMGGKGTRRQLNMDPSMCCVGMLGNASQKSIVPFIAALSQLVDEIPGLKLMILGRNYDKYLPICQEFGIADRTITPGWIDLNDLPKYLACADIFICPLDFSPYDKARWPQKVGEYMAAGRPVLCSDVGDVAKFIRDHEAGLTTDNTIIDLQEKFKQLLTSQEYASRLGQNARYATENHISWAQLAENLEAFYYKIIDQSA